MPQLTSEEIQIRENQILDAAAVRIVRYGYDKTTMSDIAEQAQVTRAIVYLHFDSKEDLFEALLYRVTQTYLADWLAALESSPSDSAIAGVFRSSLVAIRRSPLLTAMMQRDRQVFGKYLRKSGNLFQSLQSRSLWPEMLKALQDAGAVRQDINPVVMGHVMNAFALGMVEMEADKADSDTPPFAVLLETTADMLDRMLLPEDNGNQSAGRAVIRHLAQAIQAQFAQSKFPAVPARDQTL